MTQDQRRGSILTAPRPLHPVVLPPTFGRVDLDRVASFCLETRAGLIDHNQSEVAESLLHGTHGYSMRLKNSR